MSNINLAVLIVPGFLVAFGLFWSVVIFLVSRLGGWARLARQYPAAGPATGDTRHWRSATFGLLCNYRTCLNLTLSQTGLHMVPVLVFRIGHDPILIPWNAIADARRRNLLLATGLQIDVKDKASGGVRKITFYGKSLVEDLEAHIR
ncbi:hypothetical protein [Roseibium sp.]|uniref:hypothetical protein n=1 Tax=Roseibium sp. TaxID=1936156 RepID=UPI003D11F815